MKRKVLVVVNPAAGKGSVPGVVSRVRGFLGARKVRYYLFESRSPSGAEREVRRKGALYTDVVVVGGDGTLNEALNGLPSGGGRKPVLSIVPTGSGNDYAKYLRPSSTFEGWFDAALDGEVRLVDSGVCNGRRFLNGVGVGFDGRVIEEMLTKYGAVKGHAGYMLAVLANLAGYREPEMTVREDGREARGRIFMVTVGIGTTFGGGFLLTPKAVLDDGLLDVSIVRPVPVWRRIFVLPVVTKGRHEGMKEVSMTRAKRVVISSPERTAGHLDGEFIGSGPYDIRILPRSVRFRGKWR